MLGSTKCMCFIAILFLAILSLSGCVQVKKEKSCQELISELPSEVEAAKSARSFQVAQVIDGDTLLLADGRKVRLLGINAPEKGMLFSDEAKSFLENQTLNKKVYLLRDPAVGDRDKYNRSLRYVFTEDSFVNAELLRTGLATLFVTDRSERYQKLFSCLEIEAKENKRGLWSSIESYPIEVEVSYDAPGNDSENLNGEFVMIKNFGNQTINLTGWKIKDEATHIYTFGSVLLKPNSSIKIYSGSGQDSESELYWNSTIPIWNNDHDTIFLFSRSGALVFWLSFP